MVGAVGMNQLRVGWQVQMGRGGAMSPSSIPDLGPMDVISARPVGAPTLLVSARPVGAYTPLVSRDQVPARAAGLEGAQVPGAPQPGNGAHRNHRLAHAVTAGISMSLAGVAGLGILNPAPALAASGPAASGREQNGVTADAALQPQGVADGGHDQFHVQTSTGTLFVDVHAPASFETQRGPGGRFESVDVPGDLHVLAAAKAQGGRSAKETQIMEIASSLKGVAYRRGGTSPRTGFDCSGYTQYVFKKAGITLPRVAIDQYRHAKEISGREARPGDLVFFHEGHDVYHVGIYAGSGRIWHAPHTGSSVRLEKIWTSKVTYGRVF